MELNSQFHVLIPTLILVCGGGMKSFCDNEYSKLSIGTGDPIETASYGKPHSPPAKCFELVNPIGIGIGIEFPGRGVRSAEERRHHSNYLDTVGRD